MQLFSRSKMYNAHIAPPYRVDAWLLFVFLNIEYDTLPLKSTHGGGSKKQKRRILYLKSDTGFFFALTQSAEAEGWQAARGSVEQRAFSFSYRKVKAPPYFVWSVHAKWHEHQL